MSLGGVARSVVEGGVVRDPLIEFISGGEAGLERSNCNVAFASCSDCWVLRE